MQDLIPFGFPTYFCSTQIQNDQTKISEIIGLSYNIIIIK